MDKDITIQYTVWCAGENKFNKSTPDDNYSCCEWDQESGSSALVKKLWKEKGWLKTKEYGWLCPRCAKKYKEQLDRIEETDE